MDDVARGMKLEGRIGPRAFLSAGVGYGGYVADVFAVTAEWLSGHVM